MKTPPIHVAASNVTVPGTSCPGRVQVTAPASRLRRPYPVRCVAHIVAPEARKQKVFDEIQRPVFSLLERRPLAKLCTFLSYDAIREVAELPHLGHLSDTVLDEYSEDAE